MIYKTRGTCSTEIEVKLNNNIIELVRITNGCSGNLQGITALVIGQPVDEVIRKLKGIRCGGNSTSCPDQLSKALELAKKEILHK